MKFAQNVLKAIEKGIGQIDNANKQNISTAVFALENASEGDVAIATSAKVNLTSSISDSLNGLVDEMKQDGIALELDKSLVAAAAAGASVVANMENLGENLAVLKDSGAGMKVSQTVALEGESVDFPAYALEGFSSQDLGKSVYFTAAAAVISGRQEAAVELFFPTISFGMEQDGITIETSILSTFQEFTRGITGVAETGKWKKSPITKNIYNADIFGEEKNRLWPILTTENTGVLDDSLFTTKIIDGNNEKVAPVLFGKEVDFCTLGATDSLLSNGALDNTDGIDRAVTLNQVFFEAKNAAGDVTETFKIGDMDSTLASFVPSQDGGTKGLTLTYSTDSVTLHTRNTKTSGEDASVILGALPANHTIVLKMDISGRADIEQGTGALFANQFALSEIRNSTGGILETTDSVYAEIKAIVDTMKLRSFYAGVYANLENLKRQGVTATIDNKVYKYMVPFKPVSKITVPVKSIGGTSSDAQLLSQQAALNGITTTISGFKTLISHFDRLTAMNEGTSVDFNMIGSEHVIPTFAPATLNISTDINSLTSADRTKDIKELIINKIRTLVLRTHSISNYGIAMKTLNGGIAPKTTVICITDNIIGAYLGGSEIDLGPNFAFKFETTEHPAVAGKMLMSFGVFNSDRNSKPHELNFGHCLHAAPIVIAVPKDKNGGVVSETHTIARYGHFVNLPVGMQIDITDLEVAAAGKIAVTQQAI